MVRLITILIFSCISLFLAGQESDELLSKNRPSFTYKFDTRRTLINKESVVIYGLRGGLKFNEKIEFGIGIYSSNLFNVLGKDVLKDYQDKSVEPPTPFPVELGFHYFSVYGEYTIFKTDRFLFSSNHQIGLGWVDIDFVEPFEEKESRREGKTLIENSVKLEVKTFNWLWLNGGIGYRTLLSGEEQIQNAFNAPIFIVGFSLDF